ncbi:MAG: metallophosphoesterase [Clostridia bacterium]|nr:metallophosphoesterase [Clostridia bacterium]
MIPALIFGAALIVIYLLLFLDARRFVVKEERIAHEKIKEPFTIVQVSDLHDRRFGINQEKLLASIRAASPDAIVLTGDLFNRHVQTACKNAFTFVNSATDIAPLFFAEGNHEIALGETGERYIETIRRMGVNVLRDEYAECLGIRLIGLKQYASPQVLSSMLDPDRFNLVLSHRPELFPIYASTEADVVLSGHAHGGQIRLFGHGIFAPGQGIFPKYTSGLYRRQKSVLFVSKGLGNTIPVPRVFNTPELNILKFYPNESKGEKRCL